MSKKSEQIINDIKELVGDLELLKIEKNELSDKIYICTNENAKLKRENKELIEKNDILNRTCIGLKEECDSKSKKNENLTNVIRELQNNIFDLNKKNIKLNEENIELKDESKKDKTLIRCSGYDVEKLQKEIKDLKTELNMYKQLATFGSRFNIKTRSLNPGEVNLTLELNDQFSVIVTERRNTHE